MLINYLNVLSPSSLLCSLFWDVTLCTYVHCNAWCYDDLVIPSQPPPFITLAPLWRTRACRHHQDTPKKEKNRETQEWYQHNPKKKKKKKKKKPRGSQRTVIFILLYVHSSPSHSPAPVCPGGIFARKRPVRWGRASHIRSASMRMKHSEAWMSDSLLTFLVCCISSVDLDLFFMCFWGEVVVVLVGH